MDNDYVEVVLVLTKNGRADYVNSWLEQHDVPSVRIQAGFLLTASTKVIDRAFGCDVKSLSRPARLPIPKDLIGDVSAIEIPRPKRPM